MGEWQGILRGGSLGNSPCECVKGYAFSLVDRGKYQSRRDNFASFRDFHQVRLTLNFLIGTLFVQGRDSQRYSECMHMTRYSLQFHDLQERIPRK